MPEPGTGYETYCARTCGFQMRCFVLKTYPAFVGFSEILLSASIRWSNGTTPRGLRLRSYLRGEWFVHTWS